MWDRLFEPNSLTVRQNIVHCFGEYLSNTILKSIDIVVQEISQAQKCNAAHLKRSSSIPVSPRAILSASHGILLPTLTKHLPPHDALLQSFSVLSASLGVLFLTQDILLSARGILIASLGILLVSLGILMISRGILLPSHGILLPTRGILLPSRGILMATLSILLPYSTQQNRISGTLSPTFQKLIRKRKVYSPSYSPLSSNGAFQERFSLPIHSNYGISKKIRRVFRGYIFNLNLFSMTDVQVNKLRMYRKVKGVFSVNEKILTTFLAIAKSFALFDGWLTKIEKIDSEGVLSGSGTTISKLELKENLAQETVELASAAYVYAKDNRNTELMALLDLSYSEIRYTDDHEAYSLATAVHNELSEMDPVKLDEYMITAEDLEVLKTTTADYHRALQSTSGQDSVARNRQLALLFTQNSEHLNEHLDKLMRRVRRKEPVFFDTYTNARVIHDLGAGPKKKGPKELE